MMQTPYNWCRVLDMFHQLVPVKSNKPVIGITGNFGAKGCELAEGYYRSVLAAGGVPVVIPTFEDIEANANLLDNIDGLILSGGGDLNPLLFDEQPIPQLGDICPQRDRAELWLVSMAYDRQIPILGICRGIQVLAAALGGKVYQDLSLHDANGKLIKHNQSLERAYASHTVNISPNSLLHKIIMSDTLAVNSFHHQAVSEEGPHFSVSARAADGIIECIESAEHKSVLGVQWHPECFILRGDGSMLPLFRWLVDEASSFAKARSLHQRVVTLDSHCDTPMCFATAQRHNLTPAQLFTQKTDYAQVDLHKMNEGMLDACIMVAYLPQGERNGAAYAKVNKQMHLLLDQMIGMLEEDNDCASLATTPAQVYQLKQQGRKAIMMGVENGYAIGRNLGEIEKLRQRGVVYMTLCHNGDNDICDSAKGNAEHNGVSAFGQKVIAEMNRTGMLIDMSHASEKSFWDALEISQQPIVCTHSSCRALCDHPRNLTDSQLVQLARKGGVAQVNFYRHFLQRNGKASIDDAIAHILHMVNLVGVEHVGLGSDFDGGGGVLGLNSASDFINITRSLLHHKFSEDDLALILGGNFLRVMEQVQQAAQQTH